jgi:hypothetical protein
MFDLARLLEASVELLMPLVTMVRLMSLRVIPAGRFKHGATFLGEHDRNIPMPVDLLGSDEALVLQVTQVP